MSDEIIFSSPEYEVVGELGKGAMGVVYKAQCKLPDAPQKWVAVKVISPEVARNKNFQRRFLQEMKVVYELDHPNIVKAFDYGVQVEQDMFFVVLELIEGESLKDLMDRKRVISLRRSLDIIEKIAIGLEYAWSKGIVHRDVKPDNILLSEDGTVKITDFGIVKPLNQNSNLTGTGMILGTPIYISPEQVKEDSVDWRADIYSLGITLFHMLAGRPPFQHKQAIMIIAAHCSEEMPSIYKFRQDLPPSVGKLIERMTQKEAEDRFASPQELIQMIRSIHLDPEDSSIELDAVVEYEEMEPADLNISTTSFSMKADIESPSPEEFSGAETECIEELEPEDLQISTTSFAAVTEEEEQAALAELDDEPEDVKISTTTFASVDHLIEDPSLTSMETVSLTNSKHVLLVDPDPQTSLLLEDLIQSNFPDAQLLYTDSPSEAMEVAIRLQPSLIIMDVVLPETSGVKMVHLLRKLPNTEEVPIILTSSNYSDELKEQAYLAGASDFLSKPINLQELKFKFRPYLS